MPVNKYFYATLHTAVDSEMQRKKTRWKLASMSMPIKSTTARQISSDYHSLRRNISKITIRVQTLCQDPCVAHQKRIEEFSPHISCEGYNLIATRKYILHLIPVLMLHNSVKQHELFGTILPTTITNIPLFTTVIKSRSINSSGNADGWSSEIVYFIIEFILFVYPYTMLINTIQVWNSQWSFSKIRLMLITDTNSTLPILHFDRTTSYVQPADSHSSVCHSSNVTGAVRSGTERFLRIVSGGSNQTLVTFLTILVVLHLFALSQAETALTWINSARHTPVDYNVYHKRPTVPSFEHRRWTVGSIQRPVENTRFPCMYPFRDDDQTSALLADYVIVGIPLQTFQHQHGLLYNISLSVTDVMKSQSQMVFPVRTNHLVRVGQFSRHPDPNRCWIDVKLGKEYMFFIRRPDWSGYFEVSHLPLPYNQEMYSRVERVLRRGVSPLKMLPLSHIEVLEVQEGEQITLSCKVKGRPNPIVTWYHNRTEMRAPWRFSTGRGILHVNKHLSKMLVNYAHITDSGDYTCLAANINGEIRRSTRVIVNPRRITTKPETVTVPQVNPIPVHPCDGYCYQGHCYLSDGKPFCRCKRNYLGLRCELHFPISLEPTKPRRHNQWSGKRPR